MTTPLDAAKRLAQEAGIPLNGTSSGIAFDPNHDETAEDSPLIPPFPEAAWVGLFREYRDIVGPTTEEQEGKLTGQRPTQDVASARPLAFAALLLL